MLTAPVTAPMRVMSTAGAPENVTEYCVGEVVICSLQLESMYPPVTTGMVTSPRVLCRGYNVSGLVERRGPQVR